MPRLSERIPDPDVMLEMEPEQLGGCLLQIMNDPSNNTGTYILNYWLNDLFQGANPAYPFRCRDAVFRALAEAWNWLEVQGLVVWPDDANGRNGFRVPSRRGKRLITGDDFTQFLRGTELPMEFLHPKLGQKVWLLFLGGDYDTAVFQAFKEVEVSVRSAGNLSNTDLGVNLMRTAFKPDKGPLADKSTPVAEQEALVSLFSGSIGYYKNPQSHRVVGLTEPGEAREMIMLASHLLRIVDVRRP